jgi:hypothetical protein
LLEEILPYHTPEDLQEELKVSKQDEHIPMADMANVIDDKKEAWANRWEDWVQEAPKVPFITPAPVELFNYYSPEQAPYPRRERKNSKQFQESCKLASEHFTQYFEHIWWAAIEYNIITKGALLDRNELITDLIRETLNVISRDSLQQLQKKIVNSQRFLCSIENKKKQYRKKSRCSIGKHPCK